MDALGHESSRGRPGGDGVDPRALQILDGESPREILFRIVEGDPLGLESVVRDRLREDGWILDSGRAYLRSAARAAFAAPFDKPTTSLRAWLDQRVTEGVDDLIEEQSSEELSGLPWTESPSAAWYQQLANDTELEPQLARLACLVLNTQSRLDRRIFRALVIDHASEQELSERGWGTREELLKSVERTVRAVLAALPGEDGASRGHFDG